MTPKQIEKISPAILQKIGLITVLVGNTEFWLERTIWLLASEVVANKRPSTDGVPVSQLIERLRKLAARVDGADHKKIVELWSETADAAFTCRNTILHGIMIHYGEAVDFLTNNRWSGEIRKRESSSFLANEHTLLLLSEVFVTLLNSIIILEKMERSEVEPNDLQIGNIMRQRTEARSTAIELSDLQAAVNNEKYYHHCVLQQCLQSILLDSPARS